MVLEYIATFLLLVSIIALFVLWIYLCHKYVWVLLGSLFLSVGYAFYMCYVLLHNTIWGG